MVHLVKSPRADHEMVIPPRVPENKAEVEKESEVLSGKQVDFILVWVQLKFFLEILFVC